MMMMMVMIVLTRKWKEFVRPLSYNPSTQNWKETAKDRRTWRDLAEKAKTHKGL